MMQTVSHNLTDLLHAWSIAEPDRVRPHPFYRGVYQAGDLNLVAASSETSLAFLERSILKAIAERGWSLATGFDPLFGWVVSIHKPALERGHEASGKDLALALLQAYLEALR